MNCHGFAYCVHTPVKGQSFEEHMAGYEKNKAMPRKNLWCTYCNEAVEWSYEHPKMCDDEAEPSIATQLREILMLASVSYLENGLNFTKKPNIDDYVEKLETLIANQVKEARIAELTRTLVFYGNFVCRPEFEEETLESRLAKLEERE